MANQNKLYYKICREQTKKQTTIRLPIELKRKLQQEADKKGISFNTIVISIIDSYINHQ